MKKESNFVNWFNVTKWRASQLWRIGSSQGTSPNTISQDPRIGVFLLGVFFVLGLVISRWIGWYEQQVRVEGRIYQKIIEDKKIIEIIQGLSLDNDYLALIRLIHEPDPRQQWDDGVEFRTLKDHYEFRHRNSLDAIQGDADRELFATAPHDQARAFFRAIESNILSKLKPPADIPEPSQIPKNNSELAMIVRSDIDPLFEAYRATMQGMLDHARQRVNVDEDESLRASIRWAGMRALFDLLLLILCLFICWYVFRSVQYLMDQKNRMALITSATPSAILITDRNGRIQWINRGFTKLFGYTFEECKDQRFGEFLNSENTEPFMASRLNDALRHGDPCQVELAGKSRDGKEFLLDVQVQPTLGSDNRTNGFIAIQTDRSDALRLRQRLNSIFRTVAAGIVLHGKDGKIFDCNVAAERILGLTRSQILGRDSKDSRWKCLREDGSVWDGSTHPAMEALHNGKEVNNAIMGIQPHDGSLRWIAINAHPVSNQRGETEFVIASFSDITQLRNQAKQLELAIDGANLITWDWLIESNKISLWNLRTSNSESPLSEFTKEAWVNRVHPDDISKMSKALEEHLTGRTLEYHSEHRITDANGNWNWVLEAGKIVGRDLNGQPTRMSGIQLDISQSKEIEALLRENEQRQRKSIDSTLDAIICMDHQGLVTAWNRRAEECFGWKENETLGKNLSQLIIPESEREAHQAGLKRFLETGVTRIVGKQIEVVALRKDGQQIFVELCIQCIRENDSVSFTSYLRDITERKQLRLQASHAQLLESIGHVTSGVAHEINTPLQYANDSCYFIREGTKDLLNLLDQYRILKRNAASGKVDAPRVKLIEKVEEELDIDYLNKEMPKAIERSVEGLARIAEIVQSLKEFAFQTPSEFILCDINRLIKNALIVSKNEYKDSANLETSYANIPQTLSYPGELNQVILNLIIRASLAIRASFETSKQKGKLKVSTRLDAPFIEIVFSDSGKPLGDGDCHHLFDPTLKPAIPVDGVGFHWIHDAITKKLKGSISVFAKIDSGSTITLRIPIQTAKNTFS